MWSRMLLFVLPLLLQVATASQLKQNQLCMSACQEALDYFTFNGTDSDASYYVGECTNTLRVKSLYACAKYYGQESDIKPGYAYLNGVCKTYGGVSLLPYSIIGNMTIADIEGLRQVTTGELSLGETFDEIVLPSAELYSVAYHTLEIWAYEMNTHILYGWVMYIFWAIVIAVGLTSRLISHLINASTLREDPNLAVESAATPRNTSGLRQRVQYLYRRYITLPHVFDTPDSIPSTWYTIPPRIQTFTIFAFVFVNVVLCSVNYHAFKGNLYWSNPATQRWRYIADRTGIIAIANLPLVWLFGIRNNFLLWVTAWDYSTFNNFHRWVARVATLEAIIHSIAYTCEAFGDGGLAGYLSQWLYTYWYTGVIATIIMSFMLPASILSLRRHFYEVFLYGHIAMSIIFLVNLWYHIQIMDGEYNGYFWPCVAIWAFDRLARIARIVLLQVKFWKIEATATYSQDDDIIRLDVPNPSSLVTPQPGAYYYIYFFTGTRFWESHPFTLASYTVASSAPEVVHPPATIPATIPGQSSAQSPVQSPVQSPIQSPDDSPIQSPDQSTLFLPTKTNEPESVLMRVISKDQVLSTSSSTSGSHLTFLIRPYAGLTFHLRNALLSRAHTSSNKLRVAVEGPYGRPPTLHQFAHVLFIVGGTGITVPLSALSQPSMGRTESSLVWAVRQLSFFEDVYKRDLRAREGLEVHVHVTGSAAEDLTKGEEREGVVLHRGRPDITTVIGDATETGGVLSQGRCAVVVCGPRGMVDEARYGLLSALEKDTALDVEFFEESFSW